MIDGGVLEAEIQHVLPPARIRRVDALLKLNNDKVHSHDFEI